MAEFEDFVPSSAKVAPMLVARGFEPASAITRYLMLAVHGRAVVRKSWSDEVEVSPTVFQKLKELPEIDADLSATEPIQHRELDAASELAEAARCRQCFTQKGREHCHVCAGTGQGSDSTPEKPEPCMACDAGWIACAACDGTGQSLRARVHYHEDRVVPFAHAFVPEPARRFQQHLTRFLSERREIPGCLKVDLGDEMVTRDAYRGRASDSEYRGHSLGNTRESARRYLERVERAPSVRKIASSAYAWPFAVVTQEVRAVVILVDDRGLTTML